jgi:lysophospholipid acyltransferase (LPLAT)-like uncharacterized protein
LGAIFFRLIILTMRVRLTPRAQEFLSSKPKSCLVLIWHNRLSLALAGFSRKGRRIPLTGLVSASGDGAYLAEVMHAFGVQTARGSSSRRDMEATRELIAAIDAGRNIVITPDGPRGPIYTVKTGAVEVGRGHAKAICLVGLNCNRVWQLKSWDKFMFPKPFSVLELDIEKIETTEEFSAESLQARLNQLNK